MNAKIKISIIVAKDCEKCAAVKAWLVSAGKNNDIDVFFNEMDSESDPVAIDFAIEHDLDDVPSFVIGDKSFCGDSFDKNLAIEEIKKICSRQ